MSQDRTADMGWVSLWMFLVWAALGGCIQPGAANQPSGEAIPSRGGIILSDSILAAGRPLVLMVWMYDPVNTEKSSLVVSGRFGDWVFPEIGPSGSQEIELPSELLYRSGEIIFRLWNQEKILDERKLKILPGKGEGVIETYTGPRTIEANTDQEAMMVAVPKDQFGNPLEDEALHTFRFQYPNSPSESRKVSVRDFVSAYTFESRAKAGKIVIGSSAGLARTEEEELRITPSWPNGIFIGVEEWFPYSDGRQNVLIQTNTLRDPSGNLVSDGTQVTFLIQESTSKSSIYRSFTSGGSAKVMVENPDELTTWNVQAFVGGKIASNRLKLEFDPYVTRIPFIFDPCERRLTVGPVTALLNQIIIDGMGMKLTLEGMDKRFQQKNIMVNGYGDFTLPGFLPGGAYRGTLSAGGMEKTIEIILE